ncbi:MAG: enoyl-CoA hydratase-related protein, partial [Candidatus Hydrogenedentes bacterium]|nr:enoyl-CoA hydratase-related protein [Candidatus Hydrogenedentota bacterium]
MEYKTITYDRYGTQDRIGRITLNRPEKLNSLNHELLTELEHALKEVAWDDDVRVVVLRGSGRGFGAGYDLSGGGSGPEHTQSRMTSARQDLQDGARRQMFLFNLPKVTIAQVHGYCLAGSCEYAMMADLVIAAEDAKIGHPGIRGLGHPRNSCGWPIIMGMRKAKELMYTGDVISGTEAAEYGMINRAVPSDKLEEEVTKLAERIANQASDSLAVQKEAMNRWYQAMGMESSVMAAADYDYIYASTTSAVELRNKIKEVGLKEAFTWRDTPYGDLRGA